MAVIPYAEGEGWTLYQGDALEVLGALRGADQRFDALVTDPPYSSGGAFRGDRAADTRAKYVRAESKGRYLDFTGDNRDQRAYLTWCALWLGIALDIMQDGALGAVFTDWRQLPTTTDALQAGGWVWRGIVPWSKPNPRPQRGRFAAQCEYLVWGSAGGREMEGACVPGFYESPPEGDRWHIAQKPVALMSAIMDLTPEGGTVLDPFAGSGSTALGAIAKGRRCVMVERMAENCDAIADRCSRAAAQGRLW